MEKYKKVLVLGGTGAMGRYLIPKLVERGYRVDVVALDHPQSNHPNLWYIQTDDAKDIEYQKNLLKEDYDGIVDFMVYDTAQFKERYQNFLEHTDHYIYLSSYRIYADSPEGLITENSPRLLDVAEEERYLHAEQYSLREDYSLYKARGEDILEQSDYQNWTIVRPAITFSQLRFQLVTLEANITVYRALNQKPVVVPRDAMDVECTMSWAGDVAEMLARLLFNPQAKRERFTLATAEHQPWNTIAEYYKTLIGMKTVPVDTEEYLKIMMNDYYGEAGYYTAKWQLMYDRMFQRRMDNSKILNVTGMKQSELMPVFDGLKLELSRLPKVLPWNGDDRYNKKMDAFLEQR